VDSSNSKGEGHAHHVVSSGKAGWKINGERVQKGKRIQTRELPSEKAGMPIKASQSSQIPAQEG